MFGMFKKKEESEFVGSVHIMEVVMKLVNLHQDDFPEFKKFKDNDCTMYYRNGVISVYKDKDEP